MNKKLNKDEVDLTLIGLIVFGVFVVSFLLLFRLGSLTKGLSTIELQASTAPVGWHGIFRAPLYLPLNFLRSLDFYLFKAHGQFLTRLPNSIFGLLSVACFSALINLWHGRRTAILCTLLFATSAWVLHVSRLASFDVQYLFGITSLLLVHQLLYKHEKSSIIWFINMFMWGLLITIPGFFWLVAIDVYFQRELIVDGWKSFKNLWQRALSIVLPILWLPLLIIDLLRPGELKTWIGLPSRFPSVVQLIKQFVGVFVHIFIRGPEYPTLWLGRVPLLDLFTLATVLLGIYFYGSRWRSSRSRLLGLMFITSVILVGLGGSVSFSLVVPFAYIMAAMGITYMLHNWLKVFPYNPFARSFGIGLVTIAVILSSIYNLRAYFIAWPDNSTTGSTFSRRL